MLRILDPVAAVASRGFTPGTTQSAFALAGAGYRLEVADGRGILTHIPATDLPTLTWQGLALLYAGVAQGRLVRNGFVDRPVPALEQVFAGPAPEILDYF